MACADLRKFAKLHGLLCSYIHQNRVIINSSESKLVTVCSKRHLGSTVKTLGVMHSIRAQYLVS